MNTSPVHPLLPKLRELRLSGMLDTLKVRAAQAVQEHLSPGEFLALLLDDELERREGRRLAVRPKDGRCEQAKTLARFDFAAVPALNRSPVMELTTSAFVARRENILVVGPTGVGKSHLANSLAFEAIKRGLQGHPILIPSECWLTRNLWEGCRRLSGTHISCFWRKLSPVLAFSNPPLGISRIVQAGEEVRLDVEVIVDSACCPACQSVSFKVHDRYRRRPMDLPWRGQKARLDRDLSHYDQQMAESEVYAGRRVQVPGITPPSEQDTAFYGWTEHTARRMALGSEKRRALGPFVRSKGFNTD